MPVRRSGASIQAHFASTAQPCEIDSLELVWGNTWMSLVFSGADCSQSSCQFILRLGAKAIPFHTHTEGRKDRQADRQTDRQTGRLPANLLFRSAAIARGGHASESFGKPCEKSSKVYLASLRAFPFPDKGVRGAGLGQSGAPRTHSATELPEVRNLKQKQTQRGQRGKGTDTPLHTQAQTPTCTNSRGTVASEVEKFATTMSPHEAF